MSCSLIWSPVNKTKNRAGDHTLRDILEKKFGFPRVLDESYIIYLDALDDAGIEGAEDLIIAIRKHEEIQIDIEC